MEFMLSKVRKGQGVMEYVGIVVAVAVLITAFKNGMSSQIVQGLIQKLQETISKL